MKLFFTLALCVTTLLASAQFDELVIVEVDNKGLVPGKTYQFYAQFKNEGDHVHLVFGDDKKPLIIQSTEAFYQNEFGGGMSTNINAKLDSLDKTLKYDSYLSIGRTNSKDNFLSNFNMDLNNFENKGEGIRTDDGAWYVTPDQEQAYCRNGNKHILLMQLTTKGDITGQISMQGKDHEQLIWREIALSISTENAISERDFSKIKKQNLKRYKKIGL